MATSTKAWSGTGYRPNDISGNDYAGMVGMSATDRAALDAAGASWNAAKAAGDKAAMDAAHRQAEQVRAKYNYSGGGDGSQYIPYQTYDSPYQQQIDSLLGQMGSFGDFSYEPAPTYENRYAQQQQELLDALLNYGDFEWSKEEDPLWPVYKKQYLREGERATANALGQAAAATGGRPSSYAVNAATQAGDYYATKLNDIIPQLYQQAYDRWANKYSMMQQDLGAVNNQEQLDYAKFLDQLSQYNTDRGFAYNQYLDDYNRLQSALGAYQGQDQELYGRFADQVNWNYQREQDALAQAQQRQNFAQQQLDAILQNGGTPSAQLLEQSGYSGEYAQALEAAWQRQQAENQKTFAQQQLDAMLQAGRVPSAELIAQSGYSNEYVQALASYYQQQIAQAAAKAAASGRSSSGSGGGKPALTWAQTQAEIRAGNLTPNVLNAYRYYMGEDYSGSGADGGGNYGSLDFDEDEGIFTWNGKKYTNLETLIADINKVELTDEQKRQILNKFDMFGFDVGT